MLKQCSFFYANIDKELKTVEHTVLKYILFEWHLHNIFVYEKKKKVIHRHLQ